jgi:hypothetical protein
VNEYGLDDHAVFALVRLLHEHDAVPVQSVNNSFYASRKISVSAFEVRVCGGFQRRPESLLRLDQR